MRQQYRLRPEVIDRARDRLGCRSDEQLAHRLGVTSTTISRLRGGESASLGTAIAVLDAANVDRFITGLTPIEPTAA